MMCAIDCCLLFVVVCLMLFAMVRCLLIVVCRCRVLRCCLCLVDVVGCWLLWLFVVRCFGCVECCSLLSFVV